MHFMIICISKSLLNPPSKKKTHAYTLSTQGGRRLVESHTPVRLIQTNDRSRALQNICKVWHRPVDQMDTKPQNTPQSANVLVHVSPARRQAAESEGLHNNEETLNSTQLTWREKRKEKRSLSILNVCRKAGWYSSRGSNHLLDSPSTSGDEPCQHYESIMTLVTPADLRQ